MGRGRQEGQSEGRLVRESTVMKAFQKTQPAFGLELLELPPPQRRAPAK